LNRRDFADGFGLGHDSNPRCQCERGRMVLAGRTGPLIQHDDGCHKVLSRNVSKMFWGSARIFSLVPTVPVECRLDARRPHVSVLPGPALPPGQEDAERRRRQSHAERGNESSDHSAEERRRGASGTASHADRGTSGQIVLAKRSQSRCKPISHSEFGVVFRHDVSSGSGDVGRSRRTKPDRLPEEREPREDTAPVGFLSGGAERTQIGSSRPSRPPSDRHDCLATNPRCV